MDWVGDSDLGLGSRSRLYLLKLVRDRGSVLKRQLSQIAPSNGHDAKVEIGGGATIDDFFTVMVDRGILAVEKGNVTLTANGETFVDGLKVAIVTDAVKNTLDLESSRP